MKKIAPELSSSFLHRSECQYFLEPYPHALYHSVFSLKFQASLISFLQNKNTPWNLVEVPNFYTDYELVFDTEVLPKNLVSIMEECHLLQMRTVVEKTFNTSLIEKVSIEAHKLIKGQEIQIHTDNDYNESHRIIIHLNEIWEDAKGGFFVIFNSNQPTDINKIVRPLHGNAVAFEIGHSSYHAVSKVHAGERYSLVYTFYKA